MRLFALDLHIITCHPSISYLYDIFTVIFCFFSVHACIYIVYCILIQPLAVILQ